MKKCLSLLSFALLAVNLQAQVRLSTYKAIEKRIAKGKDTTFVVNFWATWCAPCVEELPYFEKLQAENKNKPLKVILLSLDLKSKINSTVVPFVKEQKLGTEVLVINEKELDYIQRINAKWSGGLPATLFVNTLKGINQFHNKPFESYKDLTDKVENLSLQKTK